MQDIVTKLRNRGINVSIVEKCLRFIPKDKLTDELIKEINQNKLEIINYLNVKMTKENMTLDDFANADMAIKVYSEVLGKEIYFVSNERIADKIKDEGLVSYLPDELKNIIKDRPKAEQLIKINIAKEIFGLNQIQNG